MPAEKKERAKLTLYIPAELADRARNAVAALAGRPLYLTMSDFGEAAVLKEVERLEKDHNKGKPFPEGRIRMGRPVGS